MKLPAPARPLTAIDRWLAGALVILAIAFPGIAWWWHRDPLMALPGAVMGAHLLVLALLVWFVARSIASRLVIAGWAVAVGWIFKEIHGPGTEDPLVIVIAPFTLFVATGIVALLVVLIEQIGAAGRRMMQVRQQGGEDSPEWRKARDTRRILALVLAGILAVVVAFVVVAVRSEIEARAGKVRPPQPPAPTGR